MKSKIKSTYIIQHAIFILVICGITGGMIYDLGPKMPLWLIILMWIIVIGYPLFTIYSYLSIPKISITNKTLLSKSIKSNIEIPIDDITSITSDVFKNRMYSIGKFHVIQSSKNMEIEIPQKLYKNELQLIESISRKQESAQN